VSRRDGKEEVAGARLPLWPMVAAIIDFFSLHDFLMLQVSMFLFHFLIFISIILLSQQPHSS
jgi:hypothetical protein